MPSKAKIIKRAITDAIVNMMTPPLVSVVGGLSDSGAEKLAHFAAKIIRFFNINAYKNIHANLKVAFPEWTEEQRNELAFRNAVHTVRFGIDFLRILKHPELVKSYSIPPESAFLNQVAKSSVILCLPHLGNWEILGQAVPCFGIKAAAVAEMFRNKKLNTLIESARQQNGLLIIPRTGAARKVIGALRSGHSVGFLADQNLSPADGGVFLDFFGLPAPSSTLPALLAQRLHLPILVGASVRRDDGKYECKFIFLPKKVDEYPDTNSLAQALLKANETLIRQYPEQYLWTYHRWRYIPENATDDFAKQFPFYAVKRPYPCPESLMRQDDRNHATPQEKG
ncbi:MAG: lysophospholipid acyltransferase family protein [Victivallales bacterium]|nr:lysophospholipid acyltransferase family protein [Victivallales bacterium]